MPDAIYDSPPPFPGVGVEGREPSRGFGGRAPCPGEPWSVAESARRNVGER